MGGPVYCWGFAGTLLLKPTLLPGGLRFIQISAGNQYTCGVTTDYRAYCWGRNNQDGQFGNGTTTPSATPVMVGGGRRFRQVAAGAFHACGVGYSDRKIYCWGGNYSGELGDGSTTSRLSPVPVASGLLFRSVTAGWIHSCGLGTDYRAFCWGDNRYGQIGDSTAVSRRLRPTAVTGGRRYQEITGGYWHTCAAAFTERAFCWGDGRNGQLGNGHTYMSLWPRRAGAGLFFLRVNAGYFHSCGVTSDNRAYCWGWNSSGQLGDGTSFDPPSRLTPVPVTGDLEFTRISGGEDHTCGVTTSYRIYCWGYNRDGELGDGTTDGHVSPAPIAQP